MTAPPEAGRAETRERFGAASGALYVLGLAALFTHELDAVRHAEWRLLYVLRELSEAAAYPAFLLAHLPLFAGVLWLGFHRNARLRRGFRLVAAGFLVVHAALHLRLSGRPEYGFDGPVSSGLIFAAAGCGAAYLVLAFGARASRSGARGGET